MVSSETAVSETVVSELQIFVSTTDRGDELVVVAATVWSFETYFFDDKFVNVNIFCLYCVRENILFCQAKNTIRMEADKGIYGDIYIYREELDFMVRVILDSPQMETGGNLFGYWSAEGDAVVVYVLGPGPKSVRRFTSFTQDADYLQRHVDQLSREHRLSHIGVWHSHHGLGLSHPSGGDVQSIHEGMYADGLSRCVLAIGVCVRQRASANAFSFVNLHHRVTMEQRPWLVVPGEGPVRARYDAAHGDSLIAPFTSVAVYGEMNARGAQQAPAAGQVTFERGFWLNDRANRLQLKQIVAYIEGHYADVKLLKVDDETIEVRFEVPGRASWRLVFGPDFPVRAPYVVRYQEGETSSWNLGALGRPGAALWSPLSDGIAPSVINRLKDLSI